MKSSKRRYYNVNANLRDKTRTLEREPEAQKRECSYYLLHKFFNFKRTIGLRTVHEPVSNRSCLLFYLFLSLYFSTRHYHHISQYQHNCHSPHILCSRLNCGLGSTLRFSGPAVRYQRVYPLQSPLSSV